MERIQKNECFVPQLSMVDIASRLSGRLSNQRIFRKIPITDGQQTNADAQLPV